MMKGFLVEIKVVDSPFFGSNPHIALRVDFQGVYKQTVEREVFFCFDRERLETFGFRLKNIHSDKGGIINIPFEILNDFIEPVVAETGKLYRVVVLPLVALIERIDDVSSVIGV